MRLAKQDTQEKMGMGRSPRTLLILCAGRARLTQSPSNDSDVHVLRRLRELCRVVSAHGFFHLRHGPPKRAWPSI